MYGLEIVNSSAKAWFNYANLVILPTYVLVIIMTRDGNSGGVICIVNLFDIYC